MALVNSFLLSILLEERSSPESKSPNLPIFTISFVQSHFELHPIHQKFAKAVQVCVRPLHPALQPLLHHEIAHLLLGSFVRLGHPFKQLQVWDRHGPERNIGWVQFAAKTWAGGDGENESDSLEILFAECFLQRSFSSSFQVDFEQVLAIQDIQAFIAHLFRNM